MSTVFERGTDGPKVIVVGVDGSTTSLRAAAYAAGLERRQSAELIVVFVAAGSPPMASLVPAAGPAITQALNDVAADLRRLVETGAANAGIRARLIEAKGDPYGAIFPNLRGCARRRGGGRGLVLHGAPPGRLDRRPAGQSRALAGDRGALSAPTRQPVAAPQPRPRRSGRR